IKSLIKSQKKHFLTFWLLNLSLTVVSLLVPLMEGNMLNVLVYTRDLAAFQKWILLLAVFVVIQIIIRYFVYKIETMRTNQFILDFNRQVLDCLFRTSTKEVTGYQPTYLHSQLLQDTDSIINFFFSSVSGLINNSVILVFTALILYRVNPLLLLSIFVFLVIYTLIYSLFKERIRIAFLEQSEASNSCFSTRNHIYQNYLEIKARERIDSAKSFLQKREASLLRSMLRMFHLRYWLSTTQFTVSSLFQFGGF
ncbi:MAG: hypothetical protein Q4A41_05425, partial [Bacillota bacterium]|nr:hypothetical protein [Bacillota bacterium]